MTSYLLKFDNQFSYAKCEEAVQGLGLKIERYFPQIGVAVCSADEPIDFAALVLPANGPILNMAEDTQIQAPYIKAAECAQYTKDLLMLQSAHQYATGKGINLWVLDTGATYRPEFGIRVDQVEDPRGGFGRDTHGHGTHVMGIAAAQTGLNGFLGVAPGAMINTVKVLPDDNRGNWSDFISGLLLAVARGAQVINMSLGATAAPAAVKDAIDHAAAHALLVAAAGNVLVPKPFFPASYENVLSVGAIDQNEEIWRNSNEHKVDIYAPGVQVFSTVLEGKYACLSGTSMAAPHVAGAAALLLEQGVPQDELRTVLIGNAVDNRLSLVNSLARKHFFLPVT